MKSKRLKTNGLDGEIVAVEMTIEKDGKVVAADITKWGKSKA